MAKYKQTSLGFGSNTSKREQRKINRENKRIERDNNRALKVSKYRARRDYVFMRNEKLSSIGSVIKIIFLLLFSTFLISFLTLEEGEIIRVPSFTSLLRELQKFNVVPVIDMNDVNTTIGSVGAFLINGISHTINFILFFVRWIFA